MRWSSSTTEDSYFLSGIKLKDSKITCTACRRAKRKLKLRAQNVTSTTEEILVASAK